VVGVIVGGVAHSRVGPVVVASPAVWWLSAVSSQVASVGRQVYSLWWSESAGDDLGTSSGDVRAG
jgi:hypothetical protein